MRVDFPVLAHPFLYSAMTAPSGCTFLRSRLSHASQANGDNQTELLTRYRTFQVPQTSPAADLIYPANE